ncbi:hypothetical protein E2562_039271 [Oryza meyeriana var. granulata]|uniref:Uncharacterized protein n=1 Tax=Oryza meyeriana var. granulata TaxID=110450 RepID=A0A6G1C4L0_9ORYZ|nr:hypothetical protein E2562_039271 [Oryza meyeriana var. granulata]
MISSVCLDNRGYLLDYYHHNQKKANAAAHLSEDDDLEALAHKGIMKEANLMCELVRKGYKDENGYGIRGNTAGKLTINESDVETCSRKDPVKNDNLAGRDEISKTSTDMNCSKEDLMRGRSLEEREKKRIHEDEEIDNVARKTARDQGVAENSDESWCNSVPAWLDAVEEACQNGIGIIAKPGGSRKDKDAVDCCNKYGVSLVFTGVRRFKH